MLKILIVEGNTQKTRDLMVAKGSCTQSDLYIRNLHFLKPDIACDVYMAADEGAALPEGRDIDFYDGIIWTGSSLNIYQSDPASMRQIDFMKGCFRQKAKIFGSCWGLQVAVVAAGGEVAENTKGREIGIARDIQPTALGRVHPLYHNKAGPFDAVAVHLDHTVRLPEGATILSGNDMSQVQALEIRRGEAIFWGVQYHPEFDLDYMAELLQKYKRVMVKEGLCPDVAAVDKLSSDYHAAQNDKNRDDIRRDYKMEADVLDPCCRLQEISNWLNFVEQGSRRK